MRHQGNFYAPNFSLDQESACKLLTVLYVHKNPERFILHETVMKKSKDGLKEEIFCLQTLLSYE